MNEREVPLTAAVEDILPIIKRFMYSEREVFLRELLSNAIDALAKLSEIARSEPEVVDDHEPLFAEVVLDPVRGTVTIADNGIGMSADEVVQYINQIAFSGAREFLDKYADHQAALIGRFGLGFYSSFMVSKLVEIETRSWRADAVGCHWSCDGGAQTRIREVPVERRGTRVICHLADDAREFLDPQRTEQVVARYLDYAPYPIVLSGRQLNVITAPWHLSAGERDGLPSERYYSLYERLNPGENHPFAWLHIDSDYPVEAHALLFVPDRRPAADGNLRMFANRVFVVDHCKELLPDWLDFLEGIVDSGDLPLNVARDRFQRDRNVEVLRNHLTLKVLSFLGETLTKRRRDFVRLWERFGSRLKYGYLDSVVHARENIRQRIEQLLGFPSSRRPLTTLTEYLERAPQSAKPVFLYLTDAEGQRVHLELLQARDREVLFLTDRVDLALVQALGATRPDWEFVRIDQIGAADEPHSQKDPATGPQREANWEPLLDAFREVAGPSVEAVSVKPLASRDIPAILTVTEAGVMADTVAGLTGEGGLKGRRGTLVINANCALVQTLGGLGEHVRTSAVAAALVAQVWDNIRLSARLVGADEFDEVVRRNRDFLALVAKQL